MKVIEVDIVEQTAPDAVESLWRSLYKHQAEHGMLLPVPDSGFVQWALSIKPLLGRFACLLIATESGQPIGFLAGRVRALPPQFGGDLSGFISEVFVLDAWRGKGIGHRLMDQAMQWFRVQGVRRVELQVLSGNHAAREAYRGWGWTEELVQMVFEMDEPRGR